MSLVRKTVILAGYRCNNRCVFCMEADKRGLPVPDTRAVMREMSAARKRGSSYLELIGGEATIRDDFFQLLACAKKLGYETVMMSTNGRLLAYPDFAEKIAASGLNELVFSIHGHDAELHDSLTGVPGSFSQLIKGIENMRRLGFGRIHSNTTVVRQNYRRLEDIGRLLLSFGIKNSEFIFVDPNCGGAKNRFYELVPKISAAAPYMRRLLDLGRKNGADGWAVRYVPLCFFKGYLDKISELNEIRIFHTEHIAPDFTNYDVSGSRRDVGRVKAAACRKCALGDLCEGIWKTYAEKYGTSELKPIKWIS